MRNQRAQRALLWGALVVLGCGKAGGASASAPSAAPAAVDSGPPSKASPPDGAKVGTTPQPSGVAAPSAPPANPSGAEAPLPTPPAIAEAVDWKNATAFALDSAELQERAKSLLEAIAQDKPELGEGFWFPLEPFIPLKDVRGPDKYWAQLHRTYAADIHALHRKRKSWEGVRFESFSIGSKPKWVKPGEEANKIGYYRSFHGKLAYAVGDQRGTVDVHTVITWQGRWYITHLSKFKK